MTISAADGANPLDLDHYSTASNEWEWLGVTLTTHRIWTAATGDVEGLEFPYQAVCAAVAVAFFRTTVYHQGESALVRYAFSALLAALAYAHKSYELILAVEAFSYCLTGVVAAYHFWQSRSAAATSSSSSMLQRLLFGLVSVGASAVFSYGLARSLASGALLDSLLWITPSVVRQAVEYLIPIRECLDAYDMMVSLSLPADVLPRQLSHLLFVTFHIQVGMGFLGIHFLRQEQMRRNMLVRMDVATEEEDGDGSSSVNGNAKVDPAAAIMARSKKFQRSAIPFIFRTALPYMLQIIAYGNLNTYCFKCLHQDLHRTVRWHQTLSQDAHWMATTQTAVSPEVYATSMDNVVHTVYDLFNRKLFSLPKILLLPGVMSRQPWLVVQVFPIIMLSDWVKAWAVTFLTTKIEKLQEEVQHWQAIRTKVESYDLKNAELLHRSGKESLPYTQRRWEALTHQVQNRLVVKDLLTRSKGFFSFIHRNFVFSVLIDCALANLIAIGKIVSSEIFVFSRAVEDAVDLLLMRSRSEAELARMETDLERLAQLRDLWRQQRESESLLPCSVTTEETSKAHGAHRIILRNLHYSRGTAEVRADHVELGAGVYALTGANGSGKSTLFRVLMSCDTNIKPIEFPPSINLLTPMEPLAEEDDLMRETSCEASIAPDGTVEIDDAELESTDEACDDLAAPGHPIVPRLSITMPSKRVVEISQTFYWPLYARPIDWIMQGHDLDCDDEVTRRRVAELLHDLEFVRPVMPDGVESPSPEEVREATLDRIVQEMLEEKEDWFSDLSGGQKSKVELVRQVFLHETCPDVLLIDETMAPLDPTSKSLVMQSLKDFCQESIIIVIYHMDVQSQSEGDESPPRDCIPSTNFFNHNIHLDHGILHVRDVC